MTDLQEGASDMLGGTGVALLSIGLPGAGGWMAKAAYNKFKTPTLPTGSVKVSPRSVGKLAKAANFGKSMLKSKGSLAGLATLGVRTVSGVEDEDGGWADSLLDIAEMAGTGAMIGGAAGAIGGPLAAFTAAGGAIAGAGLGIANEIHEYATDTGSFANKLDHLDDASFNGNTDMPNVAMAQGQAVNNITSNVEVKVNIDKAGNYQVAVDNNESISIDEGEAS